MRRVFLQLPLTGLLVAFWLAGCGGYSNPGSVNGTGAPYIIAQPVNQTVTAGQTATFSVIAAGTAPLAYQWQKNGANIAGATAASYATPVTTTADSGEQFRVAVSNSAGSVTSMPATLTVSAGQVASTVDVVTYHYDNMRSGQNLNETGLTTSNVNATMFGKKGEFMVDGKVDAQPLYLSQVTIGGQKKNVLYVATEHGSVYAFDADSIIYVADRDNMGKFNASTDQIYQEISGQLGGQVFSMPAYFNGTVYFGAVGDALKAFPLTTAKVALTPSSQSTHNFGYPGTTPSVSANGATNGIVWAIENSGAILFAFDATDLTKELYDSNQAANSRDHFSGNKFITPMVANGKVYVGTPNSVAVFGLLP